MDKLTNYLLNHKNYSIKYLETNYLTQEVKDTLSKYNLTLYELCYRIKKDISLDKEFKCKYCDKKINFDYIHKYYHEFCNNKCSLSYRNKSQEHREKIKQTCQNKYGVDNYCQSKQHLKLIQDSKDTIVQKMKQTCLNKYGVDSYSKTADFKDKQKVNTQQRILKYKATCLEKYGADSYSKTEAYKSFIKEHKEEIQNKTKQTCIERYGVDSYSKTQEAKDKKKQTCLERYFEVSNLSTPETKAKIKQTCIDKYGVENYSRTKEFQIKSYNTKKKNNSFNKSDFEEKTYQLLLTKFGKEDIERQYKSEKYPFACDFYIKSKDLYIECNGMWTHGWYHNKCLGSFDKDNPEHQRILAKWQDKAKRSKFFQNAIYVWTDLDVRKIETFKKNKLNFKVFWNLDEVKKFINPQKPSLTKQS